jgi:hypothetical protein
MNKEVINMKVVCIDNTIGNARHLELNKVYDATETTSTRLSSKYYIINTYPYEGLSPLIAHGGPSGVRYSTKYDIWIDKRSFISLEEFRQLKLDSILS